MNSATLYSKDCKGEKNFNFVNFILPYYEKSTFGFATLFLDSPLKQFSIQEICNYLLISLYNCLIPNNLAFLRGSSSGLGGLCYYIGAYLDGGTRTGGSYNFARIKEKSEMAMNVNRNEKMVLYMFGCRKLQRSI